MIATALASDATNKRGVAFWRNQPVRPLWQLLGIPVSPALKVRLACSSYGCKSCGRSIRRGDYYAAAFSVPVRLCLDCCAPTEEAWH